MILPREETYDDGSAWLCIAPHAKAADKRPPTLPATSNAWWRLRARGANDAAVNAVAAIAPQVTAVAGNAANINAVAGEIDAMAEVAENMEAVLLAASSAIDGGSATTAFTAAQTLDGGNANG